MRIKRSFLSILREKLLPTTDLLSFIINFPLFEKEEEILYKKKFNEQKYN